MTLLEFARHAPRPKEYTPTEWQGFIEGITSSDENTFKYWYRQLTNGLSMPAKKRICNKAWLILFLTTEMQRQNLHLGFDEDSCAILINWLKMRPAGSHLDRLSINLNCSPIPSGYKNIAISLQVENVHFYGVSKRKTVGINAGLYSRDNFTILLKKRGAAIIDMIDGVLRKIAKK